jgi:hypothetical protein
MLRTKTCHWQLLARAQGSIPISSTSLRSLRELRLALPARSLVLRFYGSISFPNQTYTGLTSDVDVRTRSHNEGKSYHTSKFKPWKLEVCVWFQDENKARAFEKYLKSGSGRAFAAKHF